jgi:hypothetical protein
MPERVKQPHQVHERAAAIVHEVLHDRIGTEFRRQAIGQFPHEVTQPMDLRLPRDTALAVAGEPDVLVTCHHLLERRRVRAGGLPYVDREDERVAARHIGRSAAKWPIAGSAIISTRSASARRSTSRRCSCNETGRRPECTTEGMMH